MRLLNTLAAATLSIASAITLPSFAAPMSAPDGGETLITQVRGCHRDVERHYVPEIGRSAWHYHRGRSCRPEIVSRPRPGPGPGPRDCHRNAERHFVPGYGRVLHRHRRDCSIRILRQRDRYREGSCVQIGPVIYCEN
jgi:hypothetical protein